MPQLEITIYNAAGEIVHHSFDEAQCISQEELDDAVYLIEHGCSAQTAVMLAKQYTDFKNDR
ncbi:MAG: hypothetical protein KGL39_51300 [Patescibacteria group bacterium]|nr:hypothetical protein [Patescibacteria group bacterium]